MPFGRDKLPARQVELIGRWIESGGSLAGVPQAASDGGPSGDELAILEERPITAEERSYWAFVKPVRVTVPGVEELRWSENPIDAFLFSAMEAQGLTPVPAADKRTLVRRAYSTCSVCHRAPTRSTRS